MLKGFIFEILNRATKVNLMVEAVSYGAAIIIARDILYGNIEYEIINIFQVQPPAPPASK